MSDLLWKVFEISVNLFESFVVIHFICAFLNHDFKSLRGKMVYIFGVIIDFLAVTILNQYTVYEGILGIVYVVLYFIYLVVMIRGSVLKKLLASLLANIILVFSNAVVSSIISMLFKSDLSVVYEQKSVERICMIICVQLLLVCIFDLILKFTLISLKASEWRLILSVLVISFISMVFMHISFINIDISAKYARLMMNAEFGIIMLNIVCFYMTYELSRSNAETEKLRMRRQQDEFRANYAENIKGQYEEIRRMRHDMKQNLSVISALYNEGKYSEAGEYAKSISDNLSEIEMIIDVKNDFINAILNSKLTIAKEYGIQVLCTSSSNIYGIDDVDLCNLLGNMLDNAIEAAKMCSEGYIEAYINSDDDKLLVIIANSVNESVLKSNKELLSTKRDGGIHGYGVKTIKSIAQKYNGTASFYEEGNMFYCQVLMYKTLTAKLT